MARIVGPAQQSSHTRAPVAFWALLVALLVGYVAVDLIWIARNGDFIAFDVVHHLHEFADTAVLAGAIVEHVDGPLRKLGALLSLLDHRAGAHLMWPRLTYLVGAAWSGVFGGETRAPYHANLAFLALWIVGVTLCSRRLLRGVHGRGWVEGACYAVALGLLMPGTFGPLRLYGAYFPLACVGALALWTLMASEGFARRGPTLAAGVLAGVGILIKPLFAFYLAAPAALVAWSALRRSAGGEAGRGARALHVALAAAPAVALVALWVHGGGWPIVREMVAHLVPERVWFADGVPNPHDEPYPAYSLAWLTYYVRVALADLGPAGVVGLGVAIGALALRRGALDPAARLDRRLVYLAAAVAPLVLTVVSSKEARFLFPLYPFAALVTVAGLMALRPWPRRALGGVLVAGALVTMLGISFSPSVSAREHRRLWSLLGPEEGDLWARAPRPARFDELGATMAYRVASLPPLDHPPRVAYVAVPQGDARLDERIDRVQATAFDLKIHGGCIGHAWNPFLPAAAVAEVCHLDVVDARFFDADYFDTNVLDLIVVFHFVDAYEGFEPPYTSRRGEPLPALVQARTVEEIDAALAPHYDREVTHAFGRDGFASAVDVHVYERVEEPALAPDSDGSAP